MELQEIKKIDLGANIEVRMGYKFCNSIVKAHYQGTEMLKTIVGDEEMCVIVPYEIKEDKCGFAKLCLGCNMVVEAQQIIKAI